MLITAAEMAKKLKVEVYRVRYALKVLKRCNQIKYTYIGQTYAYDERTVLPKVRQRLTAN